MEIHVPKPTCDNTLTNNTKCHRERRYFIGKTIEQDATGANTQWMHVCATCDRQLGRQNLLRQGWAIKDAMKFEKNPDMETPVSNYWIDGAASSSALYRTPSAKRNLPTAFSQMPSRTRSKAL